MAIINIDQSWRERLTTPPANLRESFFVNARGHALPYSLAEPARVRGHVLYVAGMNQSRLGTYEMMRDFNRHRVSFSTYDRMGVGHAPRYLKNPFKAHSQGFEHDSADLIQFVEKILPQRHRMTMLAHSTGALIATKAYHDRPDLFTEPVMNVPLYGMMDKRIRGCEERLAKMTLPQWLMECHIPFGKNWHLRGTNGLPLQDDYSRHPERKKVPDYFCENEPAVRAGDPTIGMIHNICTAIATIRDPAYLQSLGPLTIVTAGRDFLTDNQQVEKILTHLPHVTHMHFKDAGHETLFEVDAIRSPIMGHVIDLALRG